MASYQAYNDERLITLIHRGDREAFSALYQRYFPSVYKRVRYTIPDEDVEDVTQEVFIAVMHSISNFEGRSLFSTWLRTLTNRQVADYYRKRQRRAVLAPIDEAEAKTDDFHVGGAAHDDRIILRKAIHKLPAHYQEIILLRFAEGLQFNEIAEALKQNPEATKSLFRRAIAALRENL